VFKFPFEKFYFSTVGMLLASQKANA